MGLLFVQNHICGPGGGGESIFGHNDFVLNARCFQGNQGYSMQGVFKVIREGEIAKDIILLCSLTLFCFVLFLFYFCCCCCCCC